MELTEHFTKQIRKITLLMVESVSFTSFSAFALQFSAHRLLFPQFNRQRSACSVLVLRTTEYFPACRKILEHKTDSMLKVLETILECSKGPFTYKVTRGGGGGGNLWRSSQKYLSIKGSKVKN